ncbi:hypothetical protein Tco_0116773 [Tanacetum coccineum]
MYPPPHLSQPQISHSSIPSSQQYQSHMDHQTLTVSPIAYNSPQSSTQPMTEFPQMDLRLAVPATIQDGRVTVQQVQGRQGQSYAGTIYKGNATSSGGNNAGGHARVVKCYNYQGIPDGQAAQTTIPNTDAYDFDCDDVANAKVIMMANLSNYGSNVISEASQEKNNESLTAELERYKEQVKTFEQRLNIDLSTREKMIDSQMDDMIKEKLPQVFYDDTYKQAVIPVTDDEETLILEEVSRSKMLAKQNDPMSKEKKVNTTPINYVELNRLPEDFGKHFVPQQELSAEQAF